MRLWYRIAKFLWRFEGFKDAVETVLDERLGIAAISAIYTERDYRER